MSKVRGERAASGTTRFAIPLTTRVTLHHCWNANCSGTCRDIRDHNCVRSDDRKISDGDTAQNLGTCTNINVSPNHGHPWTRARTERHLLKKTTVGSHDDVRVYHNSIGVRQDKSASYRGAVEWEVCSSNCRPKAVTQHRKFGDDVSNGSACLLCTSIGAD